MLLVLLLKCHAEGVQAEEVSSGRDAESNVAGFVSGHALTRIRNEGFASGTKPFASGTKDSYQGMPFRHAGEAPQNAKALAAASAGSPPGLKPDFYRGRYGTPEGAP